MSTNVYYNGVQIHNVQTREWNQEVVYDDSHTDVVMHKFRMRFEGLVHGGVSFSDPRQTAPVWTAAGNGDSQRFAVKTVNYNDLASLLGESRRVFVVTRSSDTGISVESPFFECVPAFDKLNDPNRDVDNGPKPISFSILRIIGTSLLKVSFAIECCKVSCMVASGAATVPHVLSNRWSVSEEMDENHYVSRTINGKMRLSAPVAQIGDYKAVVVPGLEDGFRRERLLYSVSANGLECDYEVTDRQIHTAAPWPATDMAVTASESVTAQTLIHSTCTVRLMGPPSADRRLLISRAIQVLDARLQCFAKQPDGICGSFVESMDIIEHWGRDNLVEASARVKRTTTNPGDFFQWQRANILGKDLALPSLDGEPYPYSLIRSEQPPLYGTDPHAKERQPLEWLMLQCYLQQPCSDLHGIAKWTQSTPPTAQESTPTEGERKTTVSQVPAGSLNSPFKGDLQSDSHRIAAYSHCRMNNSYTQGGGRIQLPIATATGTTTSVFISLCPNQWRRQIDFDCERVGDWPEIPACPDTYTDNGVTAYLLESHIDPFSPSTTPDKQTPAYRVTGSYLYGLSGRPNDSAGWKTGVLPLVKLEESKTRFLPNNSQKTEVGP